MGQEMGSYRYSWNLPLILGLVLLFFNNLGYSQDTVPRDLTFLYEDGFILQDSDGDSLPDVVDVHLVLPDGASQSEIVSAANIAARLGYETTAMDLDLATFVSELESPIDKPVIVIGSPKGWTLPDAPGEAAQWAPGQGSIHWLAPNDTLRAGGIWIRGYDASGLIAAANYLSGRFPALHKPSGTTFQDLPEWIRSTAGDSIQIEETRLLEIRVDGGKEGITSARMAIRTSNESSFEQLHNLTQITRKKWASTIVKDGLYRLVLDIEYSQQKAEIQLVSDTAQPDASGDVASAGNASFNLPELYTVNGLYKDTNRDKVPDDMNGYVSYSGKESPKALIKFAARLGLETAGIRLPLVYPAGEEDHPEKKGFPILVGTTHYAAAVLADSGKRYIPVESNMAGAIEFVEKAYGKTNALVITGKDESGLTSALEYAAERIPYVWDYGKGNWELGEIQTDVRRFFQGVKGPGQVTAGIEKIKTWFERMKESSPESLQLELSAEDIPEGLNKYLVILAEKYFPGTEIDVNTYKTGFGVGKQVFEEEIHIPWEVDEFWLYFDAKVIPRITSESTGTITVFLSENTLVRRKIRQQIWDRLSIEGVDKEAFDIRVLSAYKQGFSWLDEVIIPQLKGQDIDEIQITYYNLRDSEEVRWQATDSDTRWLQEIYPVDGIITRELNIPDSAITFNATYTDNGPTYRVKALGNNGQLLLEDSFDPKYAVRPFFDLFPKYDSVRVTTGWLEAEVDGKKIADRRIKTDLERFWDHLQTDTYSRILEYVMDIQDGRPESSLAPYFDEFKLEVTLSEPNHALGILKEQITPLEALHEDIYFETLLFFRLIGNRYGAGSLSYPGRILPYVMPPEHGKPGRARITFTGKEQGRPMVKLRYRGKDREPVEMWYELPNLRTGDPKFRGIEVEGNKNGVSSLLFEVPVDRDENPWNEFKKRGSESYIDRNFVSAERLDGMVGALRELQQEGIFEEVLSYDRVGKLQFRFAIEDSTEYHRISTLEQSSHPKNTARNPLIDRDFTYSGQNLVQWNHPIPPEENHEIIARLNTFDTINAYYMATSLLGRDVYAMDLLPFTPSGYRSQAKMNALKPTLFISGRQHANEFSSTSHMLKLAEKVATDPEYQKYLDKINLVLHPMTNPDGAELAVDLHNINPTFMHHAGYLGPLGVDITRDQGRRDPRYEVANVRDKIGDTWLPDIFINMHGYPPHEWVQYFAGYSAWMMDRERNPGSNNYWIPRGYFLTGFSWYDHDDFPNNKALSFALLDSITTAVNAIHAMKKVNDEMQMRYRKYRSHEEGYGEFYRNGMWVNAPLRGRENTGSGFRDPNITYFTLTSEAPDEPARGEWLQMNAAAGLAHSTAILNYLYHGVNRINIETKETGKRVLRKTYRTKPVLPKSLLKESDSK